MTVIEQRTARGSTLAVSVASPPAFTGEVSLTGWTAAPAEDANISAAPAAVIRQPTRLTPSTAKGLQRGAISVPSEEKDELPFVGLLDRLLVAEDPG